MIVTSLAVSGSFRAVGGDVGKWVSNLPITGLHNAGANRLLLALGGLIFLQNTTNRVVRLVLDSAQTASNRTDEVAEYFLIGTRRASSLRVVWRFSLAPLESCRR